MRALGPLALLLLTPALAMAQADTPRGFRADVSGPFDLALAGTASPEPVEASMRALLDDPQLRVALTGRADGVVCRFVLTLFGSWEPSTGRYPIVDPDGETTSGSRATVLMRCEGDRARRYYAGVDGQVTVVEAGPTSLAGRLRFAGRRRDPVRTPTEAEEGALWVEGAFRGVWPSTVTGGAAEGPVPPPAPDSASRP